jgi:hypothetical protein
MPRLPNPVDDEEVFDVLVLAGVTSPGVVKAISGHNRKINWDVKTAKGQKGATTEFKDIPPLEFSVDLYLADAEDFAAWPQFKDLIDSTIAGPRPKALDIYHPDLAEQDIKSVVKAGTEGTKHDGKGGQTKTIRFQEYSPPRPKTGSPSSASTPKKNDPNADVKAELAAVTTQYQNTPWG